MIDNAHERKSVTDPESAEASQPVEAVPDPAAEAFYSGALARIARCMIALAVTLTLAAWFRFGWRVALGFACGCALAYLNFHWLEKVVNALGERMSSSQKPKSSRGVVARFLLRYLLMALGAYAIFTVSRASLHGLLAGLFLPVAGIFCEAVYELYTALKRGL
jgi:hypothetical protein